MKHFYLLFVTCLFCVSVPAQGVGKKPEYVNRTFAEIMGRVIVRDSWTYAIEKVAPLPDAPTNVKELDFSVENSLERTTVTLSKEQYGKIVIYEQYFVKVDDALAQEVQNHLMLKRLKGFSTEPHRTISSEKISLLTKRKLKFGLSEEEVEKIYGKPIRVVVLGHGYSQYDYPDVMLSFIAGMLFDAVKHEKIGIK